MECGEEIHVKNIYGAVSLRCIAQCHGRFMMISGTWDQRNGYLLADWHGALRELVALAVPAKLIEKTQNVESTARGKYVAFPISYPLSAQNFADLLGVDAAEVRADLEDMAVRWTES